MAIRSVLLPLLSCVLVKAAQAQGSTCGTAIPLTLNGTFNTYSTSASFAAPVVCTTYAGTAPVTWFRFTTGSTIQCPLMDITASDSLTCEIAFYTSCNGGQNLQSASSMCFDDGHGLWAPAETFTLSPNTTYLIRIRTSTACQLNIGGQLVTPVNNQCSGALTITNVPIDDNNSCHTGGPSVTPAQLCAYSLENTAFYRFVVASTGHAIINISNISCDNGSENNSSGFQIGFFRGNCGSLTPINCTSGSGSFVQATTDPLPAGTQVVVAIDGVSGSNCRYTLTGINVQGVLEGSEVRHLSAWKSGDGNHIRWTARHSIAVRYILERSMDGQHFENLTEKSAAALPSEQDFSFMDRSPPTRCVYRLKRVDATGSIAVSHALWVDRNSLPVSHKLQVTFTEGQLKVQGPTEFTGMVTYRLTSYEGRTLLIGQVPVYNGQIQIRRQVVLSGTGPVILTLQSGNQQWSKVIARIQHP